MVRSGQSGDKSSNSSAETSAAARPALRGVEFVVFSQRVRRDCRALARVIFTAAKACHEPMDAGHLVTLVRAGKRQAPGRGRVATPRNVLRIPTSDMPRRQGGRTAKRCVLCAACGEGTDRGDCRCQKYQRLRGLPSSARSMCSAACRSNCCFLSSALCTRRGRGATLFVHGLTVEQSPDALDSALVGFA